MLKKKRKLLFVGAFPPDDTKIFGGNVTDCKSLLDAGLAEHFDLILLDSTQRTVPPPPFWQRLIYSLPRSWKYFRFVMRYRPDAILIFCAVGLSFLEKSLMAAFGRLRGHYVLFFPRGGRLMDNARHHPLYARFLKLMMAFPHRLLCQGEVWRDFFTLELALPSEKCVVMKNWTATPALLEIGAKRDYMEGVPICILFLGWLDRSKGIFELIDAFAALHKRFPFLELNIAGEGDASHAARMRVEELGLSGSVKFLGWVTGDRRLAALSRASVFCLPSHFEGLPNAMIEAMAAGLPVIVTPVGAIPDVITDRQNGLFTPVNDPCALAAHIEELITNPSMREQLGRAAHDSAQREFTAERAVIQLLELVQHSDIISE